MECSICKEALDFNLPQKNACEKHVFHVHCLTEWSKVNANCPMCREKIKCIDLLEKKESQEVPEIIDSATLSKPI